MDKNYLIFSR